MSPLALAGVFTATAVAIGAAYRRADLLPDPERSSVRSSFATTWTFGSRRSNHGESPRHRTTTTATDGDLGRVREREPKRGRAGRVLAGIRSRIPFTVWVVLYWIMAVAVSATGYQAGLAGGRRSFAAVFYALVFGAVIMMIALADVPGSEQIQTSHQALIDLQSRLTAP